MTIEVSFLALAPEGLSGDWPHWTQCETSVRRALASPLTEGRLRLRFAVVRTLEDLRQRLRQQAPGLVHLYGQSNALLAGEGGVDLSASGAFAKLSAERDEAEADEGANAEASPLDCVLLTGNLSRSHGEPGPLVGAHVTIAMPGTLDRGSALGFTRGFYSALAAGLDLETAFHEGKLAAASRGHDDGFVANLYMGGEPVAASRDPFAALRELNDSTRAIGARIRELQRQLGASAQLSKKELLAGRYLLQERIHVGAFSEIWKAYDRETSRLVVIKLLHPSWAADPLRALRFAQAAMDMSELQHAGIAEVLAPVQEDLDQSRRFFVMRWYVGGDLGQAVERGLGRDAALSACADALEALAYAHRQRRLHRDLQPGHILLDERGRGYLADFDADTEGDHVVMLRGSAAPPYAAPELRPAIDGRADVYAAAMCVLFALRGRAPDGEVADLLQGLTDCTKALHGALTRALEPDRERRTISSAELAGVVRAFVQTPAGKRRRVPAPWADQGEDAHGRWASLVVDGVEQRMRWIERGRFSMGSDNAADMSHVAAGWRRPAPVHTVTLTSGFWLAETECTQALWSAVMGDNPSAFVSPERPVECVSWHDAQRFLVALGERVGGPSFKLPTEAQWEYACRADTRTLTYAGPALPLSEIAWYAINSQQTHPVRQKSCNPWGLHDILGNVWEWCEDGPRVYTSEAVVDPVGGTDVVLRVMRGGGWFSSEYFGVRAADRMAEHPTTRDSRVGFRLARLPG